MDLEDIKSISKIKLKKYQYYIVEFHQKIIR